MRLLLCALVLSASGCAKSDLSAHREVADAMLQRRGAPDFSNASTAEYAAIRHTPSGMLCVLPADGAFEFDAFPSDSMNAGAQCSSTGGEVATGWVAVRFAQPTTLDAAFASGVAQFSQGLNVQPWEGQPSEADRASPEGLPHYRIHRLQATINGEQRFLRMAIAEMDGWYLQQIVSGPLSSAEEAEAAAGTAWRLSLREFAAAPHEPAPPPPQP
ncbi:MAG: hypothetical protein ABL871_01785 [Terricaulis sp.]